MHLLRVSPLSSPSHFLERTLILSHSDVHGLGVALYQPHDWFGAAQLSSSMAICIVCQNNGYVKLIDFLPTLSHIAIEKC